MIFSVTIQIEGVAGVSPRAERLVCQDDENAEEFLLRAHLRGVEIFGELVEAKRKRDERNTK